MSRYILPLSTDISFWNVLGADWFKTMKGDLHVHSGTEHGDKRIVWDGHSLGDSSTAAGVDDDRHVVTRRNRHVLGELCKHDKFIK